MPAAVKYIFSAFFFLFYVYLFIHKLFKTHTALDGFIITSIMHLEKAAFSDMFEKYLTNLNYSFQCQK